MFYLKITRAFVLLDIPCVQSTVRLFQVIDHHNGVLLVVKLMIRAKARHVFYVATWRFSWFTNTI